MAEHGFDWKGLDLSPEAREVLQACPGAGAPQLAQALRKAGLLREAALLQASSLPQRAALYWAWCCVEHYLAGQLPEEGKAALAAAQVWLATDAADAGAVKQTALAAWQAAEAELAAGNPTAAGWLCRGAYWCGDNVVPPEVEVVQKVAPSPLLPGKMAALAVGLCILADPLQSPVILGGCLDLAATLDLAAFPSA